MPAHHSPDSSISRNRLSSAPDHKSLVITSLTLSSSVCPARPALSRQPARGPLTALWANSGGRRHKENFLGCLYQHQMEVYSIEKLFPIVFLQLITHVLIILFHCYDPGFPRVPGGSGSGVQQTFAVPSATTTTQS